MSNPFFRFRQFTIYQQRSAMKVTTDACLFGAWCAHEMQQDKTGVKEVLDIGTGTGLLSLMVAQKNEVQVDAVELDEAAAEQAIENVGKTIWNDTINIIHHNILHLPYIKTYDCIISNPPFYEKEIESESAGKNLAHHGHGLKLTDLLYIIQMQLKKDGCFYLLLPYKRIKEVEKEIYKANFFMTKKVAVRTSPSKAPFRLMLKGSKKFADRETIELSINNEQQQYTPEFTNLLKDYYLYL